MTREAGRIPNSRQRLEGKTVTQSLPSPAAIRKAEKEIAK
jgi:hypothetical protein